jgi:copper(I)-binding protein
MGSAMNRLVSVLALLALVSGCSGDGPVAAHDAVVTLPAVPGRPGAAYFTLKAGREPLRLTGIESARAERFELHRTVNEGGLTRMEPLPAQDSSFAAGEPLVFAPGGKHAMAFGLDPALRVGDRIPLTFQFDAVGPVTVDAEVRGPGQAHAGH